LGCSGTPWEISTTGIGVTRPSSTGNRLIWRASRCWMTTKLMPVSGGNSLSSVETDSSPPADAPMPTTVAAVFFGSRFFKMIC